MICCWTLTASGSDWRLLFWSPRLWHWWGSSGCTNKSTQNIHGFFGLKFQQLYGMLHVLFWWGLLKHVRYIAKLRQGIQCYTLQRSIPIPTGCSHHQSTSQNRKSGPVTLCSVWPIRTRCCSRVCLLVSKTQVLNSFKNQLRYVWLCNKNIHKHT